jgi:hypothetical protein
MIADTKKAPAIIRGALLSRLDYFGFLRPVAEFAATVEE